LATTCDIHQQSQVTDEMRSISEVKLVEPRGPNKSTGSFSAGAPQGSFVTMEALTKGQAGYGGTFANQEDTHL
jgi:hypothetical protein